MKQSNTSKLIITLLGISLYLLIIMACIIFTAKPPNLEQSPESRTQVSCPDTSLPWDISWLPNELQSVIEQTDFVFKDTGLADQGATILNISKEYEINPAFALAMFRKEASFAALDTRANHNNNPGNIRATGECIGLSSGTACEGVYGEINTDGSFGVYSSMEDGIKAYYVLLSSGYKPGTKRNCEDIDCVISAYAPSIENDTKKYIQQVTDWTNEYQCQLLGGKNGVIIAAPPPESPSISVTFEAAQSEINPPQLKDIPRLDGAMALSNPPYLCARAGNTNNSLQFIVHGENETDILSPWIQVSKGGIGCWRDTSPWSIKPHTWQARQRDADGIISEPTTSVWDKFDPIILPSDNNNPLESTETCKIEVLSSDRSSPQPVGNTINFNIKASCTVDVTSILFTVDGGTQATIIQGSEGNASWVTLFDYTGDHVIDVYVIGNNKGFASFSMLYSLIEE